MTISYFLYHCTVALSLFLAALGVGYQFLRLMDVEEANVSTLWLATTFGLGMLSVGTLLLGMVGLLYRALFVIILVPFFVSGVWLLIRQQVVLKTTVAQWLCFRESRYPFRLASYLLLAFSLTTVLWIFLTHALMPPHEWDEIAYHLVLPKLYIEAHRIIYVPFIVPSNWPMNNEMLFVISLLWGSDIASHLIMLGMAILTACGLLLLCHNKFDERVGIVAVALFMTVPLVKRLAGTGLIDISLGLYVLAALVSLNRWQQERNWPWLALSGIFCGFAAGSKLMGGGFPILFGLLLLCSELKRRPLNIPTVLRAAMLFGLSGLLVVGPWYARSFFLTGNPIWPFAYHIFGGRDWDALGDEYHMQLLLEVWSVVIPRTPAGLFQSYLYTLIRPAEIGGYGGGLGIVLPSLALAAILLIQKQSRLLWQSLFVCAGFYLMWFFLVSHQLRYLMPIVPLLSLASAMVFIWLYDKIYRRPVQLIFIGVLLLLVLNQWPWTHIGERELFMARLPYLLGQLSREVWLETQIDILPLFDYANTQLPVDAKILLIPYENRTYYLNRTYIWGHPISQRIIRFEEFDNTVELAAFLHRMGITHVIDTPAWSFDGLLYWQHDRALMLALQKECGQVLFSQGDAVVYQLTTCTNS